MVQQPHQVFDERPGSGTVWNVQGVPESPLVDSHAPVVLGEKGNLLPPAQQIPTGAVGKNDGLTLAETLVVNLDAVYFR